MQYVEVVANPPSRHHINRPLSVSSTRGRPQQDDQEGQEEQEEQEEGHNSPPPVNQGGVAGPDNPKIQALPKLV